MPINLPPVLIWEKNKLNSVNPILVTLDIKLPDSASTMLYVVHNTEDIVWNGVTYTAFPFSIELPKISSKGEIPTWTIRISNVTRIFQTYLEQLNGCIGATVTLRFLNGGNLTAGNNAVFIETTMEVLASQSSAQWITFKLGAQNLMRKRFPGQRYIANHCKWLSVGGFKGVECAYSGAKTSCDGTLARCRQLNNSKRFGGFIGLNRKGVRLA